VERLTGGQAYSNHRSIVDQMEFRLLVYVFVYQSEK